MAVAITHILLLSLQVLERHLAASFLSDPLNSRQVVTSVMLKGWKILLVQTLDVLIEVFLGDAVLVF